MSEHPLLYRYPEAAKFTGLSPSTLRRMVREGALKVVNIRGNPRIPRTELERIAQPAKPHPQN